MSDFEGGGAKSIHKSKPSRTLLGIDKSNVLGKRTSKVPSVFVPHTVHTSKKEDPFKEKRAEIMPFYMTVMKEAPQVKLTSAERRKVLNSVVSDATTGVTVSVADAIRYQVQQVLAKREEKIRKNMDEMDLEDLLAGLSMGATKKRGVRVAASSKAPSVLVKETAAQKARQAEERAIRYQKREQLREKLEHLKQNYTLDMDVDVIVQAMNEKDMNDALMMTENDLLDAFKTLKFGGGRKKQRKGKRSSSK